MTTEISRARGALLGLFIGDALAMPVHWYYDRAALRRDYGEVSEYLRPRNPHPDSILWRSEYHPPDPKGGILHDQASYWGRRGVHYHQFLEAGENTLNLKLARLLVELLEERGAYDPDVWLERYISFMTTPGRHRDTYVEESHREFFTNYARGLDPRECGVTEKHIGGLVGIAPVLVHLRETPEKARKCALTHLSLTHRGEKMEAAGRLFADLLHDLLAGGDLRETIDAAIARKASPLLDHPFEEWEREKDDRVIGRHLSPACYVDDALPAAIHLARKYADDPERALVRNTMLGGDNAYRGAVLGALLGAGRGETAWPERWRTGLLHPPKLPRIRTDAGTLPA